VTVGAQRRLELVAEGAQPSKPYPPYTPPPSKTPTESDSRWQHPPPPMAPPLAVVGPAVAAPSFRTALPFRLRPRKLPSWRRAALPNDEVSHGPQTCVLIRADHAAFVIGGLILLRVDVLYRITTWSMRRSPLGTASPSVEVSACLGILRLYQAGSIHSGLLNLVFVSFSLMGYYWCREVRRRTKHVGRVVCSGENGMLLLCFAWLFCNCWMVPSDTEFHNRKLRNEHILSPLPL
jgi:hypothetical protein